ncbi:hypothetical protein JY96_13505 [Aquabacterium sp. NJ1]|nr:hypothetical protein JY96_13505 [Aquabacterium sp. NJ1]
MNLSAKGLCARQALLIALGLMRDEAHFELARRQSFWMRGSTGPFCLGPRAYFKFAFGVALTQAGWRGRGSSARSSAGRGRLFSDHIAC